MATDLPQDFCPYKGLQPYTEKDRLYFFGRERDQEIIISNLYASYLTVLYGASGVGKSSVLLAGVVPQLIEEPRVAIVVFRSWQDVAFVPALKQEVLNTVSECLRKSGRDAEAWAIDVSLPLDEFLKGVARSLGGPVFLVFDQFEEYFLYHPLSKDTEAFEAEFAQAVNRRDVDVNFLLSLREDGLSKLDRFQGRIPSLLSNMLRLEHLDRAAAKDAITKPLDIYNKSVSQEHSVRIEPGLVEALLHDLSSVIVASDQAGHGEVSGDGYEPLNEGVSIETPFLQMVLTRLWDEEKTTGSRVLQFETFVRLGRAENIARTHLDKIMQKLTDQERSTAVGVLRYLVTPSGSKIAQEPAALVSWAELKAEDVEAILRRLSASDTRILRTVQIPGQPVRYEISHDVIAQAILDWRTRYVQEQDRLEAERKIVDERARAEEELARQHKRIRRSRLVAAGFAVLTLLMIIFAIRYYRLKDRAQSRELAAWSSSQIQSDPELSLLLAIEAVKTAPATKAISALKVALLESQVSAVMTTTKGNRIAGVAFSPDGRYVVTGCWDHTVRIWTASKGEPVTLLPGVTGQVNSASFSADGKYVIAADSDAKVYIWEGWQTGTPKLVKTLTEPKGLLTAAFSPDGDFVVTGGVEGKARVWEWKKESQDSRPIAELDVALAVSSAGQRTNLVADSYAPTSSQTSTAQQSPEPSPNSISDPTPSPSPTITTGPGNPIRIFKAAFNPADGDYILVTGSDRRAALVWNWKKDIGNGNPLSLLGHRFAVYDAAFSQDGKYVVTGSDDATAIVWDVKNPKSPLQTLNLGTFRVRGVAFGPNDKFVAVGSYDKFGRLWEWGLDPPKQDAPNRMMYFRGHTGLVICIAFSPDGQFVVTGSDDGTSRIWRTQRLDKNLESVTVDDLLKLAQARVTRALTPQEKEKYLDETSR